MTRPERDGDATGYGRFGVARLISVFVSTAAAEWRHLVAEVRHAFSSYRRHRDAAERELFHGRCRLMSKTDDDLPVL
jgi:hypothetical protein